MGKGRYLRLFPVWLDYRGNFGTVLPQAQALAAAAHLRSNLESANLAQHQAEWIVGRNPFSQSTMYGEGYDFPPLYAPFPGNVVGALPVGIQTRAENDVPYWPVQATWTYKEVWVHPVGRWLWLMRDLAGPALVEGEADATVEFVPAGPKQKAIVTVHPVNGHFQTTLPEGRYIVKSHGEQQTQICLPAGVYHMDLRSGRMLNFEISTIWHKGSEVRIRLRAQGQGNHYFAIRSDNLTISEPQKELKLKRGSVGTLEWSGRIDSLDSPWAVVVVADENLENRKELLGAAW